MILVTGGTGLLGAHLLFKLAQENKKLKAIYRNADKLTALRQLFSFFTDAPDVFFRKIEWHKADITDLPSLEVAFKDVTYVYHCAALVSFDESNHKKIRKTNIEGTANITNLCLAYAVKKLCYVSSIAALGEYDSNKYITEDTHWNIDMPNSIYAITKYGAEMEVWRAAQEGLSVIIVNPGVILGSGFPNSDIGKIFTRIQSGFGYYTHGVTGFVAVEDVVNVMITLMKSNLVEKRYILVAENWSYKQLLNCIAESLSIHPPKKAIPVWLLGIIWRIDKLKSLVTGKPRLLTKYTAKSIISISRYSNENIKRELNYEFTPISECIKALIYRLRS